LQSSSSWTRGSLKKPQSHWWEIFYIWRWRISSSVYCNLGPRVPFHFQFKLTWNTWSCWLHCSTNSFFHLLAWTTFKSHNFDEIFWFVNNAQNSFRFVNTVVNYSRGNLVLSCKKTQEKFIWTQITEKMNEIISLVSFACEFHKPAMLFHKKFWNCRLMLFRNFIQVLRVSDRSLRFN
jgi:hypothetical protein